MGKSVTNIPNSYPIISIGFVKSYFVHMRPYLLFLSGVAGCSGLALSSALLPWQSYFVCFVAFFLGYGFGQALTDCFQIDTDSISSPYRPLVKGIIRKQDVIAISILGLLLIGLFLVLHHYYNFVLLLLSAFGLLTYTYFKKNYWYLGPFWNSWIVMLLPVAGYLATDQSQSLNGLFTNYSLVALCIMTFASYANFVIIGYLKDIEADRLTNYKTFPVVFGWNKTVWIGNLNLLISISAWVWLMFNSYNLIAILIGIVASVIAIAGQIYALTTKDKTEKNSAFPVASTVRSFILWHLSVIMAYKDQWYVLGLTVLFYLLFELVIRFRPQKEQI